MLLAGEMLKLTCDEQRYLLNSIQEEINDLPPLSPIRKDIEKFDLYNRLWGFEIDCFSANDLIFLINIARIIMSGEKELLKEDNEWFKRMKNYKTIKDSIIKIDAEKTTTIFIAADHDNIELSIFNLLNINHQKVDIFLKLTGTKSNLYSYLYDYNNRPHHDIENAFPQLFE